MSHDPKIDKNLRKKLSSYKVNVPEFSMKRNRWDRFINFLASPAKNPLEHLIASTKSIIALTSIPLISAIMISILQMIIFFI